MRYFYWSFLILLIVCVNSIMVRGQDQERIRIGILTDCQYCDCPPGENRFYPFSLKKLDSCISDLNTQKLDAIFHLGDMIDHDFSSYDSVLPLFCKFSPSLSMLLGNHDFNVTREKKGEILRKTGLEKGNYMMDIGSWRFIILNGDDLSYFAPQEKEQKSERESLILDLVSSMRTNMMPWNGGIGKDQMNWLEQLLNEADHLHRKVIILCHFPVYPFTWYNLWNDRELVGLISNHSSVKAYFNGHFHHGNYGCYKGIHYVTFKGMVDTRVNSYAIVTLTSDSLLIEGRGREDDRRLSHSGE